jgi:hypothetical protein
MPHRRDRYCVCAYCDGDSDRGYEWVYVYDQPAQRKVIVGSRGNVYESNMLGEP